ncbi:MAG: Gamma-glutamyl phosphate reductase [Pseudomonadota bacterium]
MNINVTQVAQLNQNTEQEITTLMRLLGQKARSASRLMASATTLSKNNTLLELARLLRSQQALLKIENAKDILAATTVHLSVPMIDRLKLTDSILDTMALGCEQLAAMPDPIGEIINMKRRPTGIQVGQMRVPLGVFGMIYESRPNVTIEAAILSIKSGNTCILRGGSEAVHTNRALAALIIQALHTQLLPVDAVQLVPTQDRAAVGELIAMPDYVDVIIPRGGKQLIERVMRDAKVPVIKHLDGNCHSYVDFPCDINQAVQIVDNAKTHKYSPCNATESLLVAKQSAHEFLPKIAAIFAKKGVEMRCCPDSFALLNEKKNEDKNSTELSTLILKFANEQDYFEEYLAPIISVKIVENVSAAIQHINYYSSQHTEAILTTHHQHAMQFLRDVDSASVMVNASTRFADGFEYGLGAEIGISTDKFHARGPVGLEGLTSLKWIVLGQGEVRI